MLIDATHAEETRVVVVDGNKVEEFDFESENKRQLAGNIYLAKVTRVEPSLQAAFVDYGGNRHGFLAFSEIHPDYYQIPVADREALIAEDMAAARAEAEDDEAPKKRRSRGRGRSKAAKNTTVDETVTKDTEATDVPASAISGMDVVDLTPEDGQTGELFDASPAAEDTPSEMEGSTAEGDAPAADVVAAEPEVPADADAPDAAGEAADASAQDDAPVPEDGAASNEDEDKAYNAADHASDNDDSVESVADDDVTEEIRPKRKPRARRYKIQEVIKVRQILLVQVVKEERGNKGAALTTYLSLAGRYCVLMPNTARGGGISRKITNAADRKKLKEIANEIDVPQGAGLIVRTAGAKRTKTEIKRDYEYLQRMWEQIRELTLKSIAPAQIYEEGNLIKRSIRDLYNRDIDEVFVEGEAGYRVAKDFMKMIMPSHAKNVKHYVDPMPLFARYQVESYLSSMFNPTVQLKSGGYIVIGITEALVAIDVNSGKATKEASIEETALKTNIEAAEEVARQLRLRDLAGLVVIDFIDMEERKNNAAVEKRFKDKLKNDRARIQVGRISAFGLLEMSRQRLRPGMLEASTQPCPACHGTGLIRSEDSLGLTILREVEEEGVRRRTREVLVKAPVSIVNFLMNHKREHIAQIEARYGMSVRIEADPFLVSPDFSVEKFKTATRKVETATVVSVDASLMAEVEESLSEEAEADVEETQSEASEEQPIKKKRRRRRRRRGKGDGAEQSEAQADGDAANDDSAETVTEAAAEAASKVDASGGEEASGEADEAAAEKNAPEAEAVTEEKPKRRRSRSRKKKVEPETAEVDAEPVTDEATDEKPTEAESAVQEVETEAPAKAEKPKRRRTRKKAPEPEVVANVEVEAAVEAPADEAAVEAAGATAAPAEAAVEAAPESVASVAPAPAETEAVVADEADKPRRRGWWSMGR